MRKSDRQKSMDYIGVYLGAINDGETFYGSVLADYVKERLRRPNMYTATILRYMRTMRSDGKINFEVENKKESK